MSRKKWHGVDIASDLKICQLTFQTPEGKLGTKHMKVKQKQKAKPRSIS